jgi:hypothetical protein
MISSFPLPPYLFFYPSTMNLHLQFPVPPLPVKLDYQSRVLLCGSCFASGIGELMQRCKFNVTVNPHGIVFDPISLCASINDVLENRSYAEKDLFLHKGLWKSFRHHGSFSHPDKEICLEGINTGIKAAHGALKKAKWLVITFGSAFFYRHIESGLPVANCHKLPGKEFIKEMISAEETKEAVRSVLGKLVKLNPELHVLLTVSPVRYVRDGVVENNLSKAILLQAVHAIVREEERAFYFPAYELVMDDLRDYRFFKADLVHPNELAFGYVWEKFREAALDEGTRTLYAAVAEIVRAGEHRVVHPGSDESREFFSAQLKKCETLAGAKGAPDLSAEMAYFREQLSRA